MFKVVTVILGVLAMAPTASILPAIVVGFTLGIVVRAMYPNGGGPTAHHNHISIMRSGREHSFQVCDRELEMVKKYTKAAKVGAPELLDEWIASFPR